MIRRNCRQVRAATNVELVLNPKGAASEPLDLNRAEVRHDGLPLPDCGRTNIERPRDIRGTLKVINNVLLEHKQSFTTVKSALQPGYQPKHLTLVDMDKQLSTTAERLAAAMKDAGVSQSELARECDVSPAAVHKWLNGSKLNADNLAKASRALGVREDWLRTGKLPRERENGHAEESLDEVIDLLEDLKGPLAALAAAIEKIGRSRAPSTRKRNVG
jgi:transcriptional regulator with XRE-family HTH domain